MNKQQNCAITRQDRPGASRIRRLYTIRLILRIAVFLLCAIIYFFRRELLDILHGWNFFRGFSPLHILWFVWMLDMLWQLFPVREEIALGSQKLFKFRFQPIKEAINYPALRDYIIKTTRAAYKVFLLWAAFIAGLVVLFVKGILGSGELFMITVLFYVCDLICVLVWCPFRLIMKNRCCTTCRIFNWDHLMMFTPMLLVKGFYSISLLLMSIAVWLVWELCVMMYPERFWERSNDALTCANCTDKLCTQYCQKLRPAKKA